ncbi:sensor domain-containing protein [Massilia horti]|uniref:EAL domain-containing protein n=1 Tax=Massilia horti TaxID=2562153 RepID=A0A4Y9T549_9BURK|nr:EAL domain-containing protein [Massilia horti]TFW35007.1 EAL domain-containing protein [Massilia horti]
MLHPEPVTRAAFLTDEAGNIRTWNEGCENLFGLSAGQIIGQPFGVLLADNGVHDWADRWADLATQAHGEGLDVILNGANGSKLSAVLGLSAQHALDGSLRGSVVYLTTVLESATLESAQVGRIPLARVMEMFPGTFYALNRERRFVLWNHNLELQQEMTPDEIAASNPLDMFDFAQRPLIAEMIRQVFDEGAEVKIQADVVSKSGRETPMVLCGSRIICRGADYLFGLGVDITEQRVQEQRLRLRERALHAASNGIVITRCEGKDNPIEYVNPAFERITGYSTAEVTGRDCRFMAAPGLDANERAQVRSAINERRPVNVVFRNLRKNGDVFWNDLNITPVQDDSGKVTHFIGVINDVTATKQRTAHLEHEVNHDSLTGLANRNLLWDRLEHALHLAQRHKSLVATVLIDLNNFKTINDTFGHEAGDVVLKVVAKRLQASVRDSDTVARLSGDEFVLVLVNQPSLRFTLRMIERVREALVMPVALDRAEIPVGASLGVAVYPHDGAAVAELIRAADVAMYHAKATGRNEVHFFSNDMKSTTEAKHKLEIAMREALERDELFLLYQPRIDAHSGLVLGFEALLRWRHPESGTLLPSAFLHEAEENGTIIQIGNRVLDQVCAFLHGLYKAGFGNLSVSVNVSPREYSQHDFALGIAERLARFGLPAGCLQIELGEEGLIRNPGLGRDVAAQLRSLGLPLWLDEFGKGMSDISYLQELAPDHVKIAKSAVRAIGNGGSAFAKTLINIGHNLNMAVVGEAVETRAQADFLRNNGCDEIQGLWFSEPLNREAAERLLRERHLA